LKVTERCFYYSCFITTTAAGTIIHVSFQKTVYFQLTWTEYWQSEMTGNI